MLTPNVVRWQWQSYSTAHQNRKNLLVHALTVPIFVAGTAFVVFGLGRLDPRLALFGAIAMAGAMAARGGQALAFAVAMMGAWVLFKTQLDILEGLTRAITDILWTGSRRVRAWRGGDVRVVYYAVLAAAVVFGLVALRQAQPIFLLQLGANAGGIVFVVSSLHILRVNTTLLPPALSPAFRTSLST